MPRIAFAGTASPGNYAAYFTGSVYINGSLTVADPANKHGAIKHPDGSTRLLYSMESPTAQGSRGLARGLIYDRKGNLIASVAQEGLMREVSR